MSTRNITMDTIAATGANGRSGWQCDKVKDVDPDEENIHCCPVKSVDALGTCVHSEESIVFNTYLANRVVIKKKMKGYCQMENRSNDKWCYLGSDLDGNSGNDDIKHEMVAQNVRSVLI
jgi:hypothetical protein